MSMNNIKNNNEKQRIVKTLAASKKKRRIEKPPCKGMREGREEDIRERERDCPPPILPFLTFLPLTKMMNSTFFSKKNYLT